MSINAYHSFAPISSTRAPIDQELSSRTLAVFNKMFGSVTDYQNFTPNHSETLQDKFNVLHATGHALQDQLNQLYSSIASLDCMPNGHYVNRLRIEYTARIQTLNADMSELDMKLNRLTITKLSTTSSLNLRSLVDSAQEEMTALLFEILSISDGNDKPEANVIIQQIVSVLLEPNWFENSSMVSAVRYEFGLLFEILSLDSQSPFHDKNE